MGEAAREIPVIEESGMEENKKRRASKGKIVLGVLLGLACVTGVIAYISIARYYSERFFPGTVINGVDYGNMDKASAMVNLQIHMQDYHLDIEGRDLVTGESSVLGAIPAQDVDLHVSIREADVDGILSRQNQWLWPTCLWGKGYFYTLEGTYVIDDSMLDAAMRKIPALQTGNMKTPENAYIKGYSEEEKKYVLEPETAGTKLDMTTVSEIIRDAIVNGQSKVDLEAQGCYAEASVKSDDERLLTFLGEINKCLETRIVYDWNGNEVLLDGELIKEWISVEGGKLILDEEAVRAFVVENAKAFDTYGKNRKFMTTLGFELTLPSGAYGWRTDRDAETEELIGLIKEGASGEREPVYASKGAWKGMEDIGKSYVEADMSHQHLYLYQDGELVLETDFVSGNMSKKYDTPPGVFGLTYKTTNAVLRGADYETPVNYWMPFNGNVGMHDATWRRAFGGNIYLTNGSHGCLNLPLDKASEIYQYVQTGFPVICYYYPQEILDEIHSSSGSQPQEQPETQPQEQPEVQPQEQPEAQPQEQSEVQPQEQ